MKKFLLSAAFLLLLLPLHASDQIQFAQGSWSDVLAQAKTQNKLVFLDAFTSWCGPCKMMAKTAFVDPEVGHFFNDHFVNAQVDMEKGEGPKLAKEYHVNAYPTLLFIDGDGALVHSAVGARSAADLLQLANNVLSGNFTSLPKMAARFEAGERDRKFLKQYILTLADLGQDFAAPLAAFKEGMKGQALLEADNWEVFHGLFGRFDSEYAQYFLMHRGAFEAKFGKRKVQEKAITFYENAVIAAGQDKSKALYKNLRQQLKLSGLEKLDSILPMMDFLWADVIQDWPGLAKAAKVYIPLLKPDPAILNNVAWSYYEHIDRKSDLRRALGWIDQSIAMESQFDNLDTRAMLLYKLGEKAEAIQAANLAIEAAKAAGQDYSETEKVLRELSR